MPFSSLHSQNRESLLADAERFLFEVGPVMKGFVPSAKEIETLHDDEIIARITQVRGIGRWTVEMLLIFTLGRVDVLPIDAFGVRAYGLAELSKPKAILARGDIWRPFRAVASRCLWRAAYE